MQGQNDKANRDNQEGLDGIARLLNEAIEALESIGAPADIAARLDIARHRILEMLGDRTKDK